MGMRDTVYQYIMDEYGVEPDFPWKKNSSAAVFRHADNKKWFALVMEVNAKKLGLERDEPVDIINLKCDPEFSAVLRKTLGIFPAYHMNHEKWISIVLDKETDGNQIFDLIDLSFSLTQTKVLNKNRE